MFNYSTGPVRPIFIKDIGGNYIKVDLIHKISLEFPTDNHQVFSVKAILEDDFFHFLFISQDEKEARDRMDSLVKKLNGVEV